MEWEHFWNQLLDEHKLRSKVNDMNQVDLVKNGAPCIEQICHQIYDEYDSLKDHYEQIRDDFWKIISSNNRYDCKYNTCKSQVEDILALYGISRML